MRKLIVSFWPNQLFAYLLLVIGISFNSCNTEEPELTDQPNFIFIITDDQQCGLLGAEGNSYANTPNIDRIAKEGAVMKNFFVATPLCSDIRVPFFIRYPKLIEKGSVIDQMVLNIDLAPTIYELTKIEPLIPIHGRSFVPLLNSDTAHWRESACLEYFHVKVAHHAPSWKAVRTENWKYIDYDLDTDEMNELYDLKSDPNEERNLFHIPAYQQQLNNLKRELTRLELNIKESNV